jgi:hypothetical protein
VQEDEGTVLVGVLAEDNPEPPLADQLGQMFLAVDQWQMPQILAVEFKRIASLTVP